MTTQPNSMVFSILLPHQVFLEPLEIKRLQIGTDSGSYGFLPQRLDCVAALPAGLVTYFDTNGNEHFVAIDQGILTKAGTEVTLAVRNALAGTDLGDLHVRIKEQFRNLDEEERKVRQVVAKLETGFIRNFEQLTRK